MSKAGFFSETCRCGCGQYVHSGKKYLPGHDDNSTKHLAGGKVICGNCLEVLKSLPNNSVDFCVTSPPYWGLRSYETSPVVWDGDSKCKHDWNSVETSRPNASGGKSKIQTSNKGSHFVDYGKRVTQSSFCKKCGAWLVNYGLEPTPELYVQHTVQIFREVRRVLAPHGVLMLNIGDSYAGGGRAGKNPEYMKKHKMFGKEGWDEGRLGLPMSVPKGLKPKDLVGIPWRVAFALQADGWWLRQDIIWNKPSCMPSSITDRCTSSHEYVFLLTKAPHYYYDQHAIAEKSKTPGDCRFERTDNTQTHGRGGDDSRQRTGNPTGIYKNRRSVWTISTESCGEAHFAVMPQKLARICILAGSPREVCTKCGKPRTRILERNRKATRPGKDTKVAGHDNKTVGNRDPQRHVTETKTIGWSDCGCGAKFRPGLVCDPFGGVGTSGIVAAQLGRNYLLIEMSEKYAAIARKRLQKYKR